jgi:hypothetical protein
MELLAKRCHLDMTEIQLDKAGTFVLAGENHEY